MSGKAAPTAAVVHGMIVSSLMPARSLVAASLPPASASLPCPARTPPVLRPSPNNPVKDTGRAISIYGRPAEELKGKTEFLRIGRATRFLAAARGKTSRKESPLRRPTPAQDRAHDFLQKYNYLS